MSAKHVSNQDYMERWEASAMKPVNSNPTPDQVQKFQGTRNSEAAPWTTYGTEEKLSAAQEAAIAAYAANVHNDSSNQTKEELARWKEGNDDIAKEYQFVKPDEYNDIDARTGRIMHSSEFINILRSAGIQCWYRDHPQQGKVTLVVKKEGQAPEVGCWCQLGFAPELSVMDFDDHGVPLAEKFRGWRTPLLQLILKKVISEDVANKFFGKPKVTTAYDRYNSTLKSFRDLEGRI
jgi:hypothetical protein